MELHSLVDSLKNCPCGREHKVSVKAVEIGPDLLSKTGELLAQVNFPKNVLVVADKNTMRASRGILEILQASGFICQAQIYDDLRVADMEEVRYIVELSEGCEGILSVGSGSLNDICRLAAYAAGKDFAIFATAPSMDGFASGTSPITEHGFKTTREARQPSIIIGDTGILAAAPVELKAAGFGDMVAKYVALVDWKISHLLTGEYFCPRIAAITQEALDRVVALTDMIAQKEERSAAAMMEALVLSGVTMKLAGCVRPASGAEHIVSHFWEIKKLEQGLHSDFHGKKVGVATLMITRMYEQLRQGGDPRKIQMEHLNWPEIDVAYGPSFTADVHSLNCPTVTEETTPDIVKAHWGDICRIIDNELPSSGQIENLLLRAGAATTLEEIGVDEALGILGLKYHAYMRHRLTLARLAPMLSVPLDYGRMIRG